MVDAAWWSLLATAVGAGALLVLPGGLIAKCWQLPAHLAIALSSGITLAILGCFSLLAASFTLAWNLRTVVVLLALIVAANALVARLRAPAHTRRAGNSHGWYLAALGIGVVATTMVVFALGGAHPELPAQAWDALFHQNAIAEIARSENADPRTALRALYLGQAVTYPSLWDGIFAMFPTGAVLAYNASVLTISLLLAISSWAWFRLSSPAPMLAVGGAWITASLICVTTLTTLAATAPYAGALAALLGAASGVYALVFHAGDVAAVRKPTIALSAIAAFGAAFTHPSAAFSLLALCAPALIWAAGRAVPRWWRSGARERAIVVAASAVVVLGGVSGAWALRDKFATVFSYQRSGGSIFAALMDFPLDISSLKTYPPAISSLAIVGFVIVGAAVLYWRECELRSRVGNALLAAAALGFILDLLAAGPDWAGRMLAGPWYTQRARISPIVWIAALGFLVAIAARWLATHRLSVRRRRVAFIAVLVLGLATMPARATLVAHTYDPQKISYGTMLTAAQLDSIADLDAAFSTPTRVLVNPAAGGGYLFALSDHLDPVFKQLGTTGPPSLRPLSNPQNSRADQVCEALNAAQVTHYLRWVGKEVDNPHFGAKHVAAFQNLDQLPAVLGDLLSAPDTIAGWQVYRIRCEAPAQ